MMLLYFAMVLEFDMLCLSHYVLFVDAKVCGRNQRALRMMAWDQFHPIGKEHATKARITSSLATGNQNHANTNLPLNSEHNFTIIYGSLYP